MFHKVRVRLCSEVASSIYQTYKFNVYCNLFRRHCNVFDVVFVRINGTLFHLSDITLSKNLDVGCKYKNNHLYHVSKENVLVLLSIILFITTLLVSLLVSQ